MNVIECVGWPEWLVLIEVVCGAGFFQGALLAQSALSNPFFLAFCNCATHVADSSEYA